MKIKDSKAAIIAKRLVSISVWSLKIRVKIDCRWNIRADENM